MKTVAVALLLVGCSSTTNVYELATDGGRQPEPVEAAAGTDAAPVEAGRDVGTPEAGDAGTGVDTWQPPPPVDAAVPPFDWSQCAREPDDASLTHAACVDHVTIPPSGPYLFACGRTNPVGVPGGCQLSTLPLSPGYYWCCPN